MKPLRGAQTAAEYTWAIRQVGVMATSARPRNQMEMRELVYTQHDAIVLAHWESAGRTVYDMDPDLLEALGTTDDATVIPAGVMTRLPHPDPFVALPVPMVLPLDSRSQMTVRGFFVVGCARIPGTEHNTTCSTHDDQATGELALLIGADVQHLDGSPMKAWDNVDSVQVNDMLWTRLTLDVGHRHGETTVGAIVAAIAARFDHMPEAGNYDATVPAMIRQCVGALLYLCAKNAELRPLPPGAHANRNQPAPGMPVQRHHVVKVGEEIGTALRAWRASERREAAGSTGRSMAPHIRRSHFHTYRVGEGRKLAELKWLSPIPVNGGKSDRIRVVTVSGS
jgi:hypothetical protein